MLRTVLFKKSKYVNSCGEIYVDRVQISALCTKKDTCKEVSVERIFVMEKNNVKCIRAHNGSNVVVSFPDPSPFN